MTLNNIRRVCGAPILTLIAALVGSTMLASLAAAADDSWANAIIKEMQAAEKQVARGNVRVASLGGVDTSSTPARQKRSASISDQDRPQASRSRNSNVRVASLGNRSSDESKPRRSLSGGSVNWVASSSCLNGTLRGVIASLASNYGPVTVNSTCRSAGHNRSVGGASKSWHLTGDAADFRIHSNVSAAYAYLRGNGSVGGLKHYGGGLFHIDTGDRRSW